MEQINIIFYILTSFFGMERGAVAAETATIIVDTVNKTVTIVQENLFTVIESATDKNAVISNWQSIAFAKPQAASWAEELDNFSDKKIRITADELGSNATLSFGYVNEDNLRVLGIWYNREDNEFSINHVPKDNLETATGNLKGNYWVFPSDETFSFTVNPFKDMPAEFQKAKVSIGELIEKPSKN